VGVRNNLLFVTCHGERFEEGLSYALDLARTMSKEITILMIFKKGLMQRIEDMMTAVTFAEAGEHETALMHYVFSNSEGSVRQDSILAARCRDLGVPVTVQTANGDIITSITDVLGTMKTIEMVLLSPSVAGHDTVTARGLRRLVRTASRPVVTMRRQAETPA
jgi:hypothetical protein